MADSKIKLQILIPTFNRKNDLKKNLDLLAKEIEEYNLTESIGLLVSDNCSEDDTAIFLKDFQNSTIIDFNYIVQSSNKGLEQNAVDILSFASADYIIFLGDDDFLPNGYLKYCVAKIHGISNLSCIIPAFNSVYEDGTIIKRREANFEERIYDGGFSSLIELSSYGHQLSGLLFKRDKLVESYLKFDKLRNIYPFVFWLGYCLLNGVSIFVPKFRVAVAQFNKKDWGYDSSGLLNDILLNFKSLQKLNEINYLQRFKAEYSIIANNLWRLRLNNFRYALNAVKSIILHNSSSLLLKIYLLPYVMFEYYMNRKKRKRNTEIIK